jgi:hypothetical protein
LWALLLQLLQIFPFLLSLVVHSQWVHRSSWATGHLRLK